jgi:predicted transposase/invertase (TIGR01784 family)
MKETYIDPFTDFGFKKLFGEEESKEYLIDFLNSVFGDFIPYIQELNYHKNEHLGNKAIDRSVIFDLYCKDPQGNRFIIELQKARQDYFKQRTLFYSTFAITEQSKKGEWDFSLSPVYCISILNFTFDDKNDKYITKAKILDIETYETIINELNFAFIECPKFNKNISINSSMQDKWLYVLTHLTQIDNKPIELQEKLFEEFFQRANILKLDTKELGEYNASLSYYRDIHNIEHQNLAKGKLEKQLEIAKNMKQKDCDLIFISEVTGLTIEEIEKL